MFNHHKLNLTRPTGKAKIQSVKETLLFNGNVVTLDPHTPRAEAVLLRADRIAFVGDRRETAVKASGGAQAIDLEGRTLIPGFNDNHIHTLAMGNFFSQPKLHGLGKEEIIQFLRDYYRNAKPGKMLFALGWDYPHCPDPHRSILDEAFPDNPVVLIQFSGHGMWLNSRALSIFGINRKTTDPPGGKVLRDERGDPTGILRDAATRPIHRKRFRRMHYNRRISQSLFESSLDGLREAGITSVQDNSWYPKTVGLYNRFRRSGRLTCRISCWFFGAKPTRAHLMNLRSYDGLWVTRGPWKYFLDGTFSTRTAWLMEPYADEPENRGMRDDTFEKLEDLLTQAARHRRQLAFHAIGDRAIHEFVNTFEKLQNKFPGMRNLRIRLEHAQLIHETDIPRIRDLGILISAQPSAMGTPGKDITLLGRNRAEKSYAYRSLLDGGVQLSFGSDMPGEPTYNPLLSIHYVVNRAGAEALTAREALGCYTQGSAYAEFKEKEKGSIEAGKLADLTLLSDDLLTCPSEKIKDINVEMTIVGGNVVYRRTDRTQADAARTKVTRE